MEEDKEEEVIPGYYTDEKIREKIDKELHKMAIMETDLGISSTISEYKRVKKKQATCMKRIKKLDLEFHKSISPDEDDD